MSARVVSVPWARLRPGALLAADEHAFGASHRVLSVEPVGNGWVSVAYEDVETGRRDCVERFASDRVEVVALLWRGEHKLAHMSQVLGRDLKAETIERHPGARAYSYALTEEQHADRVAGKPGTGLPYRYLVRSPSSAALPWTAFYTVEELRAFCDAYGLAIEGELTPGSRFSLRLPEDLSRALPLERRPALEPKG